MRRLLFILGSLGFLVFGGWMLANMDKIRSTDDFFRILGHQISELGGGAVPQNAPWRSPAEHVIRIGSFNANGLNDAKTKDPRNVAIISEIIRHFDVVAIQEFDAADPFAIKRFVKNLNATGRSFEIVRGTSQPGLASAQQSVILYDASVIELESGQYYNINDPDDVLLRDPLVAWFRTRADTGAFTFTLVNVHLDPSSPENEMRQLGQIFRAVRNDGRAEDDVILAGDFGVGGFELNELAANSGLQAVNTDMPTNTSSTNLFDNFMLDPLATSEFTGEAGVFDFMKLFNLTLEQAQAVSDHLPVWAEFDVFEQAANDRVAEMSDTEQK